MSIIASMSMERHSDRKVDAMSETTISSLRTIKPGQAVIYHVGCLMIDRVYDAGVATVASVAMAGHQYKKLCLTQRKLGSMKYEYIAVGR